MASALAAHEVIKYKERDREEEERLNSENQELSEVVETMKRILEQQNRDILTLTELIKTYRWSLDMVSLDRETEMHLQAEVRTQSNMAGTNIPFNNVRWNQGCGSEEISFVSKEKKIMGVTTSVSDPKPDSDANSPNPDPGV